MSHNLLIHSRKSVQKSTANAVASALYSTAYCYYCFRYNTDSTGNLIFCFLDCNMMSKVDTGRLWLALEATIVLLYDSHFAIHNQLKLTQKGRRFLESSYYLHYGINIQIKVQNYKISWWRY